MVHCHQGYRRAEVQAMCDRFLQAAAGVLGNESMVMAEAVYGDSHGLNGGLQGEFSQYC